MVMLKKSKLSLTRRLASGPFLILSTSKLLICIKHGPVSMYDPNTVESKLELVSLRSIHQKDKNVDATWLYTT